MRSRVVLPAPFGPSTTSVSPAASSSRDARRARSARRSRGAARAARSRCHAGFSPVLLAPRCRCRRSAGPGAVESGRARVAARRTRRRRPRRLAPGPMATRIMRWPATRQGGPRCRAVVLRAEAAWCSARRRRPAHREGSPPPASRGSRAWCRRSSLAPRLTIENSLSTRFARQASQRLATPRVSWRAARKVEAEAALTLAGWARATQRRPPKAPADSRRVAEASHAESGSLVPGDARVAHF